MGHLKFATSYMTTQLEMQQTYFLSCKNLETLVLQLNRQCLFTGRFRQEHVGYFIYVFLLFMYICIMWCACICVCTHVCECICTWRPEVDVKNLPQSLFQIILLLQSLSIKPRASRYGQSLWLACLGNPSLTLRLGLWVGCYTHKAFIQVLGIGTLVHPLVLSHAPSPSIYILKHIHDSLSTCDKVILFQMKKKTYTEMSVILA